MYSFPSQVQNLTPPELKLEGLRFKAAQPYQKFVLRITLPSPLNMRGRCTVKDFPQDHVRYRNCEGDFFSDCTGFFGFHAPCEMSVDGLHHRFFSLNRWIDKYQDFEIRDYPRLTDKLHLEMSQDQILGLIRSNGDLERYLSQWVRWINEFNSVPAPSCGRAPKASPP